MMQRNKQIDAARGVLILLMLIGHIWDHGWFRAFIYVFHMPAFFILSGMLFRHSSSLEKPLWRTAWKKIRTLLIPFFFFEVFSIVETVIRLGPELNAKGYLYQILTLQLTNGPLWFLIVLLCAELLFILIWKLKRPIVLAGLGIILFVASFFMPKVSNYISPTMIVAALVFLIGGYFAHDILSKPSLALGGCAFVVTALLAAVNPVEISCYQDGIPGLFFLSGFAGAMFVLQLSRYLKWAPLTFLGKNSLIILGTHYPLFRFAVWILSIRIVTIAVGIVILAWILLVEVLLILLINRWFPFVLGKWYQPRQAVAPEEEREENGGLSSKKKKQKLRTIQKVLLIVLSILVLLATVEIYISNTALQVTQYTVCSEKITAPIRIVFFSDLHGKEFGSDNERLLDLIAEQKPDLIAVGGDIFNNDADEAEIERNCSFIRRASEIAPVYFCMGNHEFNHLKDPRSVLPDRIRDAGATVLDSEYLDVELNGSAFRIGGYMGFYRQPGMMSSLNDYEKELTFCDSFEASDRFKLLLDHIPTSWIDWDYRNRCDVDLVLCGHYHGGVIRIPFLDQGVYAPYIGWFPPYTKGMFEGEMATCILTTGLAGYGAIPRFFNRPEICVVDVVPT